MNNPLSIATEGFLAGATLAIAARGYLGDVDQSVEIVYPPIDLQGRLVEIENLAVIYDSELELGAMYDFTENLSSRYSLQSDLQMNYDLSLSLSGTLDKTSDLEGIVCLPVVNLKGVV